MQIKVMSWNIWLGRNIPGIITHISQLDPDIIGLQEVTEGYSEPLSLNSAVVIRDKLAEGGQQYHKIYFPAFESDRHPTKHKIGNAVLSKYPIKSGKFYFLSDLAMYRQRDIGIPPRDAEPRIAIDVQVEIGNKTVRVINTHLGVSESLGPTSFTDIQIERLIDLIGNGENTILMGDFNTTPESKYIEKIGRVLRNTDKEQLPTWPLLPEAASRHKEQYGPIESEPGLLTHRIDQIFIGGSIETSGFLLGNSSASDHKSLLAFLEV